MTKLMKFVCLTLIVAFFVQLVSALKCYQCNSNVHQGCDELSQPIEVVECKSNDTLREDSRKIAEVLNKMFNPNSVLYCLRVFVTDRHGHKQTYRECYEDFKVFPPCEMVTKSLTVDNDHIIFEDCEVCEKDLCNEGKFLSQYNASSSSLKLVDILLFTTTLTVGFYIKVLN